MKLGAIGLIGRLNVCALISARAVAARKSRASVAREAGNRNADEARRARKPDHDEIVAFLAATRVAAIVTRRFMRGRAPARRATAGE